MADHYRHTRERLLDLAGDLDEQAAATPVPTCPAWTVKDVYSHLAGACSDALAGRIEGAATDPWTARQVAERADRTLAEVAAEWRDAGPAFDDVMAQLPEEGLVVRVPVDAWTHEQDVRGALSRPGGRDAPVVAWALDKLTARLGHHITSAGLPPLRVVGSSREWVVGDGEPTTMLRGSDFELLRMLIGRRSRAQALAMFEGDGATFVDELVVFTHAAHDIAE